MSVDASALRFAFVDTDARDGAWNMAFDVERAHAVQEGTAAPLVRVYRWKPWCISLGRHQSMDDIDLARCDRDGIGCVRRPTGGRAILHAEELTYSVIMPSGGRGVMEVYKHISEALATGLRKLIPSLDMAKTQPDFQRLYREPGSIPCFSSSARYEIEIDGRKVVGSAQRRIGDTVLQHGSILLGDAHLGLAEYLAVPADIRSALAADMRSHTVTLSEALGRPVGYDETRDALRSGFEEAWELVFTEEPVNS